MKRDDILKRLRDHELDLRSQGVMRAALFGSVARDEQRADSDIDLMIELDEAKPWKSSPSFPATRLD